MSVVRRATPDDAELAADLAVLKRREYEPYSPVFWRRADDDRSKHAPFLRRCVESDGYASFAVDDVAVVIANTRGAPPPFAWDAEPTWLVDDFFVTEACLWATVGRALLDRVADEAIAANAARLVVVAARRDTAKRSFLLEAGYETAAFWSVRPLTPTTVTVDPPPGVTAIVGPAPPVYDPGGVVSLATSRLRPELVHAFTEWSAAQGAVLAIVPTRAEDSQLSEALGAAGYDAASEWFSRRL